MRPANPQPNGFFQRLYHRVSDVFYVRLFKTFANDEPQNKIQWHLSGLLREFFAIGKGFNHYFPFGKLFIMFGFFFAGYSAFSLSATTLVSLLFWFSPFMAYTAPFVFNVGLQLAGIVLLPGIYLQFLKIFELWPLKNQPVSFYPRDMFNDVKNALYVFDWQILKWISRLLTEVFFPDVVKQYAILAGKMPSLPQEATFWQRAKNIGAWLTVKAWQKTTVINTPPPSPLVELPERKVPPQLFRIGLQARIHNQLYMQYHYEELSKLTAEKREKHLQDENYRFLLVLFERNDTHNGFFASIKDAIVEERRNAPRR